MTPRRTASARKLGAGLLGSALVLGACFGSADGEPDAVTSLDNRDDVDRASARLAVEPWVPGEAGLCAGAPADLFGQAVWVDATGLWRAPHEHASTSPAIGIDRFEPGEIPTSPVVFAPDHGLASELAVAVAGETGCTLRRYESTGVLVERFEVPASRCLNPSFGGRYFVWPLGPADADTGDGGRLAWIDGARLREVTSLALGASPLTPAVAVARDGLSGGGSHWLVGTSRGVLAIKDPLADGRLVPDPTAPTGAPRIVGDWSEPDVRVTTLVTVGGHAVVSLAGQGAAGLGDRLRVLALARAGDAISLSPVGEVITLPGPLTAHPVARLCEITADTGASDCPPGETGLVVTGGQGWIAGWYLPSGAEAFSRTTALTWTGISLGRGGWVAGGGSHWLPSGAPSWRALAFDAHAPAAEIQLGSGAGSACVPSPLWDTNGDVVAPILGAAEVALVRGALAGVSGDLALAPGSPRPHGTARNGGTPQATGSVCADGVPRGLWSMPLGDDDLYGFDHAHGRTIAYGRRGDGGLLHWLPDEAHALHTLVLGDAPAIERALLGAGDEAIVAAFDAVDGQVPGSARLSAYRVGATLPSWSHQLDADAGSIVGLVPGLPGEYLVAARQGSMDELWRVDARLGVLEARVFGEPDDFGLERLVSDAAGGAFMVLGLEGRLVVRHIGPDMAPLGLTTWARPERLALPIDASVDGLGRLRVLLEVSPPDERASYELRWITWDRDLGLIEDQGVPYGGDFATRPDGSSLISAAEGLVRVSPEGAVGVPRLPSAGILTDARAGLRTIAATSDGFLVGFLREDLAGAELVWGPADLHGFVGCADAGLCLGADPAGCDRDAPCEVSGCAPANGGCETVVPQRCAP